MVNSHFTSRLGFSLYLSSSLEENLQHIEKYYQSGFSFAFTSLNLIEKSQDLHIIEKLVQKCRQLGIVLFVDINEKSFAELGIDGLKKLGVEAVRVDDGISAEDMARLSKEFQLVLNASTLDDKLIASFENLNIDFRQVIACHNYYPKPYTGLTIEKVRTINRRLHQLGVEVISFISGDHKRFPLFEGLPTIEKQREMRPLQAALESMVNAACDYICVGDTSLFETSLQEMTYLSKNVIPLKASVPSSLKNILFENRIDASEYVIRAAQSRAQLEGIQFDGKISKRSRGDIVVATDKFLRYESELEICLQNLPKDERQLTIGKIKDEDIALLDYVQVPFKFQFICDEN